MKINIASSHRFHLLDLARELSKQGHDVRFYSYVPTKRCDLFGLNRKNCHSLVWLAAPFFLLCKMFPSKSKYIIEIRNILLDNYMAYFMRPCDVYICLGTVYKKSIVSAKKKYNAITILEWGSKHIIEQLKCFDKLSNYPKRLLQRQLDDYNFADYISIPASHVKNSFIKNGIDNNKLIVNPYGVDLSQFNPTVLNDNYDIITVGGWRYEKGSDLLMELCKKYKYKLLHVGAIVGLEFPECEVMHHIEPVNQNQLINYYSKAKIFVLPSRAEGLALVQAQALVCGLPIVCSKETGGSDLRNLITDKKWIIEMKDLSLEELNKCVVEALELSKAQTGERNYLGGDISNLTWEAYGQRYNNNIYNIYGKQ